MIVGTLVRFKLYSVIKGYWSLWVAGSHEDITPA